MQNVLCKHLVLFSFRWPLLSGLCWGVHSVGFEEISLEQQLWRIPSATWALWSESGRKYERKEAAENHKRSRPVVSQHQQVRVVARWQTGSLQTSVAQEAQHSAQLLSRLPKLYGRRCKKPSKYSETYPHSNQDKHRSNWAWSLQEGPPWTCGEETGESGYFRIAISARTGATWSL